MAGALPRQFTFTLPDDQNGAGNLLVTVTTNINRTVIEQNGNPLNSDLRTYTVGQKGVSNFWDMEAPRFVLVQGPKWLRLDEKTGALTGTPDAGGAADVVVKVTLERPPASWTTAG